MVIKLKCIGHSQYVPPSQFTMSSFTVSPSQIVDHRESRKASGLVGCITGRPVPEFDFFGYRDVQIWNIDASGRLNGDEGFNPRDPGCFCFDCRGAFDPRGEVDAELVNEGHARATEVYQSVINQAVAERQARLEREMAAAAVAAPPSGVGLAHTANSTGFFYARPGCPCVTCTEWRLEPAPTRAVTPEASPEGSPLDEQPAVPTSLSLLCAARRVAASCVSSPMRISTRWSRC